MKGKLILIIIGLIAFYAMGSGSFAGQPYDRSSFGSWIDSDHDCINTRSEILARDAVRGTVRIAHCRVVAGTWVDPYTGVRLNVPARVQIDHVYPLAEAWRNGADQWTQRRRIAFANDPLNTMALAGPVNGRKSDQDMNEWCIKGFTEKTVNECPVMGSKARFEARYLKVAAKYGLSA